MDLLDGPDPSGPYPDGSGEADVIEMDAPRRPWERYAQKWQRRWQESRRITRAAITGAAIVVLAGGAGIAYTATGNGNTATGTSATGTSATGTGTTGTSAGGLSAASSAYGSQIQVQWADGPKGKPWAVVTIGSPRGDSSGVQFGTVTSVSPSSLTVKSADGTLTRYSVSAATQVNFKSDAIGSVRKGDEVSVIATRYGTTDVATVIEGPAGSDVTRP